MNCMSHPVLPSPRQAVAMGNVWDGGNHVAQAGRSLCFALLCFAVIVNSDPVSWLCAAMMGTTGVSHPGGTCEGHPSVSQGVLNSETCVSSLKLLKSVLTADF